MSLHYTFAHLTPYILSTQLQLHTDPIRPCKNFPRNFSRKHSFLSFFAGFLYSFFVSPPAQSHQQPSAFTRLDTLKQPKLQTINHTDQSPPTILPLHVQPCNTPSPSYDTIQTLSTSSSYPLPLTLDHSSTSVFDINTVFTYSMLTHNKHFIYCLPPSLKHIHNP